MKLHNYAYTCIYIWTTLLKLIFPLFSEFTEEIINDIVDAFTDGDSGANGGGSGGNGGDSGGNGGDSGGNGGNGGNSGGGSGDSGGGNANGGSASGNNLQQKY